MKGKNVEGSNIENYSELARLWSSPLAVAEHEVFLLTKAGFRLHLGRMQIPERYHPAVWKIIATCAGFLAFGFGTGILAGLDIPN